MSLSLFKENEKLKALLRRSRDILDVDGGIDAHELRDEIDAVLNIDDCTKVETLPYWPVEELP